MGSPRSRPRHPTKFPDDPRPRRCGIAAVECAASACVFCICCPLAILWCCVQIPLRAAAVAVRQVRTAAPSSSCHGGRRRLSGFASSSFSDIDFEADSSSAGGPDRLATRKERSRVSVPLRRWESSSQSANS